MHKTLLTALAATAFLSGATLGNRAEAMTLSALGVAIVGGGLVKQVTTLCSANGCRPVQTQGPRRHPGHP
jgi:hypothetical protein